jgi:hypothetical protein
LSVPRRYRAPAEGGVLAEPPFEDLGNQLRANRAALDNDDILIDGTPLPAFRREAAADIVAAARQYHRDAGEPVPDYPDGPLLMSGHQPELSHVGVLVKTFGLNGIARKHGLTPINLIVDNDTTKTTATRLAVLGEMASSGLPVDPDAVHLLSLPYDRFEGEVPYELRPVIDPELFASFPARALPIARAWPFRPILPEFWAEMLRQHRRTPILGEIVAATRRHYERRWGCHNLEIPLSRMCATGAFQRFARHVLNDLPRFHAIYNESVADYRKRYHVRSRNHPVPDLHREGDRLEAPFWDFQQGGAKRARLLVRPGDLPLGPNLRSRALTTTMFMRVCLADGFIHGIGGAKYDEVTDAILERWLGLSPPGFIVITATLRLPLPRFPTTRADLHAAERKLRDLDWNPQRHLAADAPAGAQELTAAKARLVREEPVGRAQRKAWYRRLGELTDALRPFVSREWDEAQRDLERRRREWRANELLMRRDYAWCMFPEDVVSAFCRQLL